MSIETGLELATISNGTSLSAAVNLHNQRVFAINMPAAWDAANLTFQGSQDGNTFQDLYDDTGAQVTVTAAASHYIVLSNPLLFLGLQKLKVRSGTSGSPVNQTADRIIQLIPLA